MKRLLLSILFVFLAFLVIAQEDKPVNFKGTYNVYPVDTTGVVLLNRNLKQLSNGEFAFEFKGLDKNLNEKWKNLYPFSRGMSPVFQNITSQGIMILFADRSQKQYEMIKASVDYGDYERFKYTFSEPLRVSEMEYFYDEVWIAGLIGDDPAIFKLNADNNYSTIPTGTPGKLKYVGELSYDRSTSALNFVMLSEIEGKDVLMWRSLSTSGKPLKNEMLNTFDRKRVRAVNAIYEADRAYVSGTFSSNARERVDGIFWGEINAQKSVLKTRKLKEVKALSFYKTLSSSGGSDFAKAETRKFKGAGKLIFIDDLQILDEEQITIALEVYKPEFRNRGALESQFVARDRTAQIDQNVYGRRDAFFGGAQTRDLEARMETYSATDQLQYRFMNQSLGKAINQGISYSHTVILTLDKALNDTNGYGLSFGLDDFGRFAGSDQFIDGKLHYPSGNKFWQFDVKGKQVKSLESPENSSLVKWTKNSLLQVAYDESANQLTLVRRGFN